MTLCVHFVSELDDSVEDMPSKKSKSEPGVTRVNSHINFKSVRRLLRNLILFSDTGADAARTP